MFNSIDTKLIALHQSLVDWIQREPRVIAQFVAQILSVVMLVSVMLKFDTLGFSATGVVFALLTLFVCAALVTMWLYEHGTSFFRCFLVISLILEVLLALSNPFHYRLLSVVGSVMFLMYFYLAECKPPAPPKRKFNRLQAQ